MEIESALCRYELADDEKNGWKGYAIVHTLKRYSKCPECGSTLIQHRRSKEEGDFVRCGNPDCHEVSHLCEDMSGSLHNDIMHAWMCAVEDWWKKNDVKASDPQLEKCLRNKVSLIDIAKDGCGCSSIELEHENCSSSDRAAHNKICKEKPASSKIALYIGSFDPFTIGHMSIYEQAMSLFDNVIICFAKNPAKKRRFTLESCMEACRHFYYGYVRRDQIIISSDKLAADIMKENSCSYMVRGLRNTSDYLYEEQIFSANKELFPEFHVVYFRGSNNISSTFVRELYDRQKDISRYVPYNPNILVQKIV